MILVIPLVVAIVGGTVAGVTSASRPQRLAAWLAAAVAAAVLGLVVLFLTSPTESPDDCSDCNEYFGRWLNGLWFLLALAYVLVFALAAVVAGVLRSAFRGRGASEP